MTLDSLNWEEYVINTHYLYHFNSIWVQFHWKMYGLSTNSKQLPTITTDTTDFNADKSNIEKN